MWLVVWTIRHHVLPLLGPHLPVALPPTFSSARGAATWIRLFDKHLPSTHHVAGTQQGTKGQKSLSSLTGLLVQWDGAGMRCLKYAY